MIQFDKNIKFGGQGCPPYGTIWNYNETKQNIENSVNSFVDFYKNYNK